MAGEFEAAGDAMTGAVVARVIEPDHGEARGGGPGACLNCGSALLGNHCHVCGQSAHVHRTLEAYGHDLLHGVFHFEGKIWSTLPLLAIKPGELTRRYIHGERAKFVSPLALFLFAVFLMFAVVSSLAGGVSLPEVMPENRAKSLAQIEGELAQHNTQRAKLSEAMKVVRARGGDADALNAERDAVEQEINGLKLARNLIGGKSPTISGTQAKAGGLEFNITGWPQFDAAIKKANANPSLLLYKLQSSAYKYAWGLIPLSVPFVWLLFFWRREYKMYDHAVFVTYSLTFMLFLVVLLTLVGIAGAPEPVVPLAAITVPPLHIYRQLRGAYGTSRLGGIVRTIVLCAFGTIVLVAFLMLLLVLGASG